MGKKSRRQRGKGVSHSEGNKVINPNSVPPFMRGTIVKNNCIRAFFDNPRYLVCSGCGVARYCSEACQAADWRNHEQECYKHQLAQVDDEIDREWERQGV